MLARGHYTIGEETDDECIGFQGFLVYDAYGGNTGLLLQVSVDNGENSKFSLRVWACTQVAIAAEEPCNTDVCVHSCFSTRILLWRWTTRPCITVGISSLTAPLRSCGARDVHEFRTDSVHCTRFHLMLCRFAASP